MTDLRNDIAAFDAMRDDLEARAPGMWSLFHKGVLINTYDTFDDAAEDAVRQFGRGPYLIRQVGAPELVLPASVMYNLHA